MSDSNCGMFCLCCLFTVLENKWIGDGANIGKSRHDVLCRRVSLIHCAQRIWQQLVPATNTEDIMANNAVVHKTISILKELFKAWTPGRFFFLIRFLEIFILFGNDNDSDDNERLVKHQ